MSTIGSIVEWVFAGFAVASVVAIPFGLGAAWGDSRRSRSRW